MSSILTRTAADGSELLYMWTVLFSAYFLALRWAALNVALIAAVYPTIAITTLHGKGIAPSAYLVGTSIVTLLIVSNLRRQLTRVLTETALEARTDKLTGLANRRSWEEGLAREISRQNRDGRPLSVLLIDLDHFKDLNDTYGHAAGDTALAGVAGILRGQARQSDILARVGGEEFALLLVDCAVVADRVRDDQRPDPGDDQHGRGLPARPRVLRYGADGGRRRGAVRGEARRPQRGAGVPGRRATAAADRAVLRRPRLGWRCLTRRRRGPFVARRR